MPVPEDLITPGWTFRPMQRADLPRFAAWIAEPHVMRWWQEPADLPAVEARYGPSIDGTDPTELFVVAFGGSEIGFIQRYLLADNPGWLRTLEPAGTPSNAAGIDYLIADEARIGKGLGPGFIAAFVADTWERYPDIEAIVVDVDPENRRSWRALEKAGFERRWSGDLEADDPTDSGPAHVYVLPRP